MTKDVFHAMAGGAPRHKFIRRAYKAQAYQNQAIPIGYGQTISEPAMVTRMTALLELQPGEKVPEIGIGSGYQAAILAELGDVQVNTLESTPELAEKSCPAPAEIGHPKVHSTNMLSEDGRVQ